MEVFLFNMRSNIRLFIKSNAGIKRLTVIGNVSTITQKILSQTNLTTVNTQAMVAFLYYLKSQMPDKSISIVLDNARGIEENHYPMLQQALSSSIPSNRIGMENFCVKYFFF